MSWESDNPWALVDTESDPERVVARYTRDAGVWFHLRHLEEHGGSVTREKIRRGGYDIRMSHS